MKEGHNFLAKDVQVRSLRNKGWIAWISKKQQRTRESLTFGEKAALTATESKVVVMKVGRGFSSHPGVCVSVCLSVTPLYWRSAFPEL